MSQDPYKTLNVDKSASEDEVKKSYRRLAHKYHPDKEGGDEKKFKEVNSAFQILGNKEKRQQFDQFGTTFDQAGGAGGQGPFGGFGGFGGQAGGFNVNFEDLGDLFGGMFGGGRAKRRAKGQDIVVDLELEFSESILGVKRTIVLHRGVSCDSCSGTGAEAGTTMKNCTSCNGSGQVTQMQRTILGNIQTSKTCTSCQGQGQFPEINCKQCRGAGIEKKNTEIEVHIPAGIDDGATMKFAGKGEASTHKGVSGDLYVRIHVQDDKSFERKGFDLHTTKFVSFKQVVLGDTVDVKTVDGLVNLKIPSATQSGTIFRVKGRGVKDRGDMYVRIEVDVPKKMSRKAKKLLEEFEQELS